jgi:hypothetical protein
MKCANCDNDAYYIYRITDQVFTPYCEKDLPKFLDSRRKAGLLETTATYQNIVSSEPKATTADVTEEPTTEAPIVEEPVIEEPVVEEPVTEAPVTEETKTVKKTAKSKED